MAVDIKSWIEKTKQFLREVKVELKKVAWPAKKETVASTSIVLIIVVIISFYLGFVDFGLSRIVKIILS
jgi:preprotein translocase subunit SecE